MMQTSAPLNQKLVMPLCVDLDGTLVRTDILVESIFALLKQNILYLFLFPSWLYKGKAYFKQRIADRVDLDVSLLPYNQEFLTYLKEEKAQGRSIILATASNVKYAENIALFLGVFDEVLGSDIETNLSGHRKRKRLIDTYGDQGFDYAGNARIDIEIWAHAREAILVNPEAGVQRQAEQIAEVHKTFKDPEAGLRPYIKALRLLQWTKNLLIFIPLIMSHQLGDLELLWQAVRAFLAFGLCASSVYLLNDLFDLEADRQHPTKRNRPLAAGTVPIKRGTILIPALLFAAFAIALSLPTAFIGVLTLYYAFTLMYSLRLKRVLLVDVLLLAGLYTVRIIAGAAAVAIMPSFWLLAFSMFLFLSLALVKRYSELLVLHGLEKRKAKGRRYHVIDLETLAQSGITSGFMAVLVLALYIDSEQVKTLYAHPEAIWMLCPLLLYWISRIWLLARRGEMHEDPLVFAIEDQRSRWLGLIGALIFLAAV